MIEFIASSLKSGACNWQWIQLIYMICGHLEYAFVVSQAEEMIAYRLMVDGYWVNIYLICIDHRSIQAKNIRVLTFCISKRVFCAQIRTHFMIETKKFLNDQDCTASRYKSCTNDTTHHTHVIKIYHKIIIINSMLRIRRLVNSHHCTRLLW